MAIINNPPVFDPVVDADGGLKARLPWILWANNVAAGDVGTAWTPNFVGLTQVGMAQFSGTYFIISNALVYFRVIIVPGTNTSSTAGTTYIDNFPLNLVAPSGFFAIAGNANGGLGTTNAAQQRMYTPTWTTITSQIVLAGIIEAS